MKKSLILLFLIIQAISLEAQSYRRVSGFQGAKWSLGFGVSTSPSYEPQKMLSEDFQLKKVRLNVKFTAFTEYTVGNYTNIGLRVGISSTSAYLQVPEGNEISWQDDLGPHYLRDIVGTPGINDQYFGLYLKHFIRNRGALAPIGLFFGGGINVHKFDYDYSLVRLHAGRVSNYDFRNGEIDIFSYANPNGSAIYPEIFIEAGKVYPLGNHALFELSCKGAFLFTGMGDFNNSGIPTEPLTPETMAKKQIRNRLIYMNVLNYSIKVSGLW